MPSNLRPGHHLRGTLRRGRDAVVMIPLLRGEDIAS